MAARYWIGTGTGNWSDTANWSTTQGGAGGASVPTASDIAYVYGVLTPFTIVADVDITCSQIIDGSPNFNATLDFSNRTINVQYIRIAWEYYRVILDNTTFNIAYDVNDLSGIAITQTRAGSSAENTTVNINTGALPNSGILVTTNFTIADLYANENTNLVNTEVTNLHVTDGTTFVQSGATIDSIDLTGGKLRITGGILPSTITMSDATIENEQLDTVFESVTAGDNCTLRAEASMEIGSLTMGSSYNIEIEDGQTLTLDNVSLSDDGGNYITNITGSENAFISHQSGLVETDKVTITGVQLLGNALWYVGDNSTRNAGASGFYFQSKPIGTEKKLYAKVFKKSGEFVDRLDNIVNQVEIQRSMSSLTNQLTITLAEDLDTLDETNLIRYYNNIKLILEDKEYPHGKIMYDGYIDSYNIDYTNSTVNLNVLAYDSTLDDYLLKTNLEFFDGNDINTAGGVAMSEADWLFPLSRKKLMLPFATTPSINTLTAVRLYCKAINYNLEGNTIPVTIKIYENQSDAEAFNDNYIGTKTANVSSLYNSNVSFAWADPLQLDYSTTYYCLIESPEDPLTIYAEYDVAADTRYYNGSFWQDDDYYLDIGFYAGTGETEVTYSTTAISTMVKNIIDSMEEQGGRITYTQTSISTTLTSLTYTFNSSTILEALNKCTELAGDGWYWYIDPASNILYFRQLDDTVISHRLNIGGEIGNIKIEKRTKNIVSDVYFTGGDTGSGVLYNRYTNDSTADEYAYRANRLTDGRVTVQSTAEALAQTVLSKGAVPEVIVQAEIIDNLNSDQGYDIESFELGQYILINNTNGTTNSIWDFAQWDVDYWDYNLAELHTVPLQIMTITWKFDTVVLELGAFSDNYYATIENTKRSVKLIETKDTPSTPS